MYQQLVKELLKFEKDYRAYGEGRIETNNRAEVKEKIHKTGAWVAAKILLKHLDKEENKW